MYLPKAQHLAAFLSILSAEQRKNIPATSINVCEWEHWFLNRAFGMQNHPAWLVIAHWLQRGNLKNLGKKEQGSVVGRGGKKEQLIE